MTFDICLHEVCVRTGVRYVITKFSGKDSLPDFLTHGAPFRARFARAGAPLLSDQKVLDTGPIMCRFFSYSLSMKDFFDE